MDKNKPIWNFFVENFRLTFIVIISLIVLGGVSILGMTKESAPDIDIPIAVVNTIYPGASAIDVETLVTDTIEKKLINLDEVEKVSSNSRRGISSIIVQFDADSNSLEKISELKDGVDEVKSDLPKEAFGPIVKKIRLDDVPVLIFSISGDYDVRELKSQADDLKKEIERINGVSEVIVSGGSDREIQVNIDKASLDNFNLSILQVTQAIEQADSDIPIGEIETAGSNYNLRLAGKISSVAEVASIPITTIGDSPVLVSDVAEVVDGYAASNFKSRLSIEGGLPQTAVSLQVYKVSGADTVKTISTIKEKLEENSQEYEAKNISLQILKDDGNSIKADLNNLMANGLGTILIVLFILFLFLGRKEAILASLVVPFSYLISLLILSLMGYTLNILTLFSLILALGILVDSSIVIVESIHREIKRGLGVKEAIFSTISKYKAPLTAGVLTTVFTFMPMIFLGGIVGKFIISIPVTVTIVLLSSLFVSLAIITTLSSFFLKKEDREESGEVKKEKKGFFKKAMDSLQTWYGSVLDKFLDSKKKQKRFAILTIILLIASWSLPLFGVLKVNMFPDSNEDTIYVDLKEPIGTNIETTDVNISKIEDLLIEDSRINSFATSVGGAANSGSALSSGSGDAHLAGIVINLDKERKEKSDAIISEYQDKFKDIFDSKSELKIYQSKYGPIMGAPIDIQISGDSLDKLEDISIQIKEIVKTTPGTINTETSIQETSGEFVIYLDRVKAKIYGVNTQQVAGVLRNAIHGVDVVSVNLEDQDDVDILVKYKLNASSDSPESNNKIDISDIENLTIATAKGQIPLSSFASIKIENSHFDITHLNGDRVVNVKSNALQGYTASTIFKEVNKEIKREVSLPEGYEISTGGEMEMIADSFSDLIRLLFVGIFLIVGLLVWQFNSYKQTLFTMMSIVFSTIGVFFGLVLVNQNLSFPGLIGIVALAGIVVNNAIILIDQINKNIKSGLSLREAVLDASKSRLQPILLTTITTIAGILPLAISNPVWGPLGYSIVFGLAFSTIITLLAIPLLYFRFSKDS